MKISSYLLIVLCLLVQQAPCSAIPQAQKRLDDKAVKAPLTATEIEQRPFDIPKPNYGFRSGHNLGKYLIRPEEDVKRSAPWLNNITSKIERFSQSELLKLDPQTKFKCLLHFHSAFSIKPLVVVDSQEVDPVPWKSYKAILVESSGSKETDEKLLEIVQKGSPIDYLAPFLCGYRFPIFITISNNKVTAEFGPKSEMMDIYDFRKPETR